MRALLASCAGLRCGVLTVPVRARRAYALQAAFLLFALAMPALYLVTMTVLWIVPLTVLAQVRAPLSHWCFASCACVRLP